MTVFGHEGYISNVCQFNFYDWCYFRESTSKFPFPSSILGRVLGPADETAGNQMCQWILRVDGLIVPRHTARHLTSAELINQNEIAKRRAFDLAITRKLGTSMSPPPDTNDYVDGIFCPYQDEDESPRILEDNDDNRYDSIINAEVLLTHQGKQRWLALHSVKKEK